MSTQAATADPAERIQLRTIPMAQLTSHPGNVRQDLKVSKEFRASVLRRMLTPLLVVEAPDGGYKVFDGNRRLTVLVEAERDSALCLVFEDVDAAEEYLAMTTTARQREGLSDTEQAVALFQAAELGADVRQIAQAAGLKQKEVRTAIRFVGSESLRQAVQKGKTALPVTLDHMAALIEFEDDPDALKVISGAVGRGDFDWVVRRLRNERDERIERAKQREEYVAAGIRVFDSRDDLPEGAEELWRLRTTEGGDSISTEDHLACPGHAVAPHEYGGKWTTVCLDPAGNGHHLHHPRVSRDGQKRDPAAEAAVVQGNKDWVAANDVRREWLAQFARRKSWPKETQDVMSRFVASQILLGGHIITSGMNTSDSLKLACQWLALGEDADWAQCAEAAAQAAPGKLPLIQFAAVAAIMERQVGAKDRRAWRTDRLAYTEGTRKRIASYLQALGSLGYELSPVERAVAEGRTYDPFEKAKAQPAPDGLS
ncbi:ParB/RepB/Spo0J family partition protein [Streptomyces albogriseolus]|uniref:ParB/RepB/Spo0J family partition protein n=1 Tax=Streptomyces albogriseolus TaxID=1887 RepID=UPI0034600BE9